MNNFLSKKMFTSVFVLFILSTLVFGAFILLPKHTMAEKHETGNGVVLLQPIDRYIEEGVDFGGYLSGIFRLGVGIASVLAVIMIIIGGITYMATGSISQKANGKEMIQDAILGLVLALVAFLLLNTINPALLDFDLEGSLEGVSAPSDSDSGSDNN